MKKIPPLFLALWTLFFIKGLFHCALLPMWGGFDEWLHYSYVAYLSRTGSLPTLAAPSVPKEVADSLKLVPGSHISSEAMSFQDFWNLLPEEKEIYFSALSNLVNDSKSPFVQASWQAQHPPLYYLALSPFYKLFEGKPLAQTLWFFRILSLFIASLGLIPAYFIFRKFFDEIISLAGILALAGFPSTFILFGHMTNDALAFPLFAGLILWALHLNENKPSPQSALIGGILLGLGILTKIYVLTALPAILLIYGRRRAFRSLAVFLIAAAILASPWIHANLQHYGTWNPTVHAMLTKDEGVLEKINGIRLVDWKSFAISNVVGLLWAGNWSFVTFPPFYYKAFAIVLAAFLAGVLFTLFRTRSGSRFLPLILLVLFDLGFLLGLIQHQVQIRMAGNLDSTGAWYWAVLLPVNLVLLFGAVQELFGDGQRRILIGICLMFGSLTMWGMAGYLLPYYSGFLVKNDLTAHFIHSFPVLDAFKRLDQLNFHTRGLLMALGAADGIIFLTLCAILFRNASVFPLPSKRVFGERRGSHHSPEDPFPAQE